MCVFQPISGRISETMRDRIKAAGDRLEKVA